MVTKMNDLLTVSEAALLVRLSPETIRRWAMAGQVTAYRHGKRGHLRISRQSLLNAMVKVTPAVEEKSNLRALIDQAAARVKAAKRAERLH